VPQAAFVPIFTSIGFSAAAAAAAAAFVQAVLINVALAELSKALTKRPRLQAPPINVTVRNTVENRRLLFGTVRASGSFVYYTVSGDNNKFLWYVVALAGHQVAAISDVWIDTQRVGNGGIGGGAAGGGAVTTGVFANKLWIYKHLGTQAQTADAELDAASTPWTSNHRLRGTAYLVVKMERDDDKFPQGAPQNVTALTDGALLYDPRKDSTNGGSGTHRRTDPSTWEFGSIGRNPALIWRWFVSGGSVHNDSVTRLQKYGLREADIRIDDTFIITAANKCEESVAIPSSTQQRYRCDLEVSTGETRREIIEHILATMAGSHVYVHGVHRLYAGAYHAPVHSFTAADLYGELEVQDTFDHEKRYNAVAGVFRDSLNEYVEQTTIFRTDASYETQDGSRRIPIEIDLRGVTDQYQAQRLCEIKLRKSRMMRTVKLVGALNLLKVAQFETLTFSHARFSWAARIFRCMERHFEFEADAGRVTLTCQREDSAVYNDLTGGDYTTGTSATDVFVNETPDPPTNARATGLQNAILLQCEQPAVLFPGTTYEWQESTAITMTSPTTVYSGADTQFTINKIVTTAYYYQVRSLRGGQPSAWVPSGNGVQGKVSSLALALSATISPGSASSSTGAASQTTNAVVGTPSGGTPAYSHAHAFVSGGTSITVDNPTAASCTFSATGLTSGETRSGTARYTVTDTIPNTYSLDYSVTITRPAPTITVPAVTLESIKVSPTNASVAFKVDADGHWYSSVTTAAPTTDQGLWCNPIEYAADYEIKVTRTAGTETVFTSGPTLGSWHALSTDREWRLTEDTDGNASKDITFTIEIRRIADSGGLVSRTGNTCISTVEL
jgi:hypothetical protein